jgi:glutathione S-transferase
MITLHHLNDSRSQRILWLLEELGLEYEIVAHQRNPKTQLAPRALRELHPLGKAPLIEDDGLIWAESGAIVEYLIETYGAGRMKPAAGDPAMRDYRYWVHYAEGSAMPPLVLSVIFNEMVAQSPLIARPVMKSISKVFRSRYLDREIHRHATFWNDHLSEHTWFAGDEPTGADVQMSFPLEMFIMRGGAAAAAKYPHVKRFVDALQDRPAYKRAQERGEAKFDYA